MNRLGHIGAALLAAAAAEPLLGRPDPLGVAALVAGALAPDIDRRLGLPHRGPTHSLALLALLLYAAHAAQTHIGDLGYWFVLGAASHVAADLAVGRVGVQLLWPSGRRVGLRAVGNSPAVDYLVFTAGVAALAWAY